MPSDTDPAAARSNGDLVIDVQCNNRAPANRSQAEQLYPGRIPRKVIRPLVLTGMVQWCEFIGVRVGGSSRCTFKFIASTAGKAEIVKLGLAAWGFRDEVVYNHRLAGIGLCGLTVGTTMVIGIDQLLAQCFG